MADFAFINKTFVPDTVQSAAFVKLRFSFGKLSIDKLDFISCHFYESDYFCDE